MGSFDLVIFDLDGTLVDSRQDLAVSVNYMRKELGFAPLHQDAVVNFIGRGARMLVRRALPKEWGDKLDAPLEIFLHHYFDHLLDHTIAYPGVLKTLDVMCWSGLRLSVLTNKPEAPTLSVLEGLNLAPLFDVVLGGDSLPTRKPDPAGVFKILESVGAPAERTLYVGDSEVDVETARAAGLPFVGVTYGFSSAEELRRSGAGLLVNRFMDLVPIALGEGGRRPPVPAEPGK